MLGYQLSPTAMEYILKRYSKALDDGRLLVAFDDFVSLSVRLRAYTGTVIGKKNVNQAVIHYIKAALLTANSPLSKLNVPWTSKLTLSINLNFTLLLEILK